MTYFSVGDAVPPNPDDPAEPGPDAELHIMLLPVDEPSVAADRSQDNAG
jgi:hypothetical protein